MNVTAPFPVPPPPPVPTIVVPPGLAPWQVRVGVDLTSVTQVAESVARLGPRYLDRIYTQHERDCCVGSDEVTAAALAARFAAKEAALKALRPAGTRPPWLSIEVRRMAGGACGIRLTGSAKRLADEAGITDITLSMTHEHHWAVAVVVALCGERRPVHPDADPTGDQAHDETRDEI